MNREERSAVTEGFNAAGTAVRVRIEDVKEGVKHLLSHPALTGPSIVLEGANIPETMQANMAANITLAFRHLEDARMRIGKAMQANQGGISIFDRNEDGDTPATQEENSGPETEG